MAKREVVAGPDRLQGAVHLAHKARDRKDRREKERTARAGGRGRPDHCRNGNGSLDPVFERDKKKRREG